MSSSISINETVAEISLGPIQVGLTISATEPSITIGADDGADISIAASEVSLTVGEVVVGTIITVAEVEIVTVAEQGEPGIDGTDGIGQHTFPFSWGDATPASLMSVSAGQMILAVTISLGVPFNGAGASLSLGDAGDTGRLLASNMIDPTVVGAFENAPCLRFGSNTQILLTIVPGTGASSGSGVVSLYLE